MLYNYSRHTQKNSDVYHLFIPVHTHTHTHTHKVLTYIHTGFSQCYTCPYMAPT